MDYIRLALTGKFAKGICQGTFGGQRKLTVPRANRIATSLTAVVDVIHVGLGDGHESSNLSVPTN